MSRLYFSPEGQRLFLEDTALQPVLGEFALEELGDIREANKSYRTQLLGSGGMAMVFAVGTYPLAEKVWTLRSRNNVDKISEAFARNLGARKFWLANRPENSRIYVPEYYAAVEHPDTRGAILLERIGDGDTVARLNVVRASRRGERRRLLAERIGAPNFELLAEEVDEICERESNLIKSIFETAIFNDEDPMNLVIDWVQAEDGTEEARITIIDV